MKNLISCNRCYTDHPGNIFVCLANLWKILKTLFAKLSLNSTLLQLKLRLGEVSLIPSWSNHPAGTIVSKTSSVLLQYNFKTTLRLHKVNIKSTSWLLRFLQYLYTETSELKKCHKKGKRSMIFLIPPQDVLDFFEFGKNWKMTPPRI